MSKKRLFKDVLIGETFWFGRMPGWSMEFVGPWKKISARRYSSLDGKQVYLVGSIRAWVQDKVNG